MSEPKIDNTGDPSLTKTKKELSEIQRFALQAAREKAVEAQGFLNRIVEEILKEFSIPKEDIKNWQFTENFKYIEKIKRMPDLTIPSDKRKKENGK